MESKTFEVYGKEHPLRATAIVVNGEVTKIKLHGCKIQRGYYNSVLNDAYTAYEEQFLNTA